jgi:hypothetical protein
MGWFSQTISAFGSKAKAFVNVGLRHSAGAIDFIKRGLAQTNNLVSRILETAHNMPILADVARHLEQNPYFQKYRDLSSEIDSALDSVGGVVNDFDGYINRQSGSNPHIPNMAINQPNLSPAEMNIPA